MVNYTLHLGDCLEYLRTLPDGSVDTVITDPPYGISFMDRDWDHGIPGVHFWAEALRAAKPGATLLAFGGTRTFHRLTCAIEDAGWEIRDCLMWLYGTGFPKSHDISKGIDKAAGATREVVGYKASHRPNRVGHNGQSMAAAYTDAVETLPATPAAQTWDGWGTALKPAWEPIILAMKPLDGTFAQNAARHGVAGLNIDGARVGTEQTVTTIKDLSQAHGNQFGKAGITYPKTGEKLNPPGRWPANLLLDEDAAALLDQQSGERKGATSNSHTKGVNGSGDWGMGTTEKTPGYGDTGGASRFFYVAKASRSEREAGLDGMPERDASVGDRRPSGSMSQRVHADEGRPDTRARNYHPTVKPLALMRYLCTLTATPTGGVVLDPFMGSGTTGVACMQTGRNFIGCEIDPGYFAIAQKRIENAAAQPPLIPHETEQKHEQEGLWP